MLSPWWIAARASVVLAAFVYGQAVVYNHLSPWAIAIGSLGLATWMGAANRWWRKEGPNDAG